MRRLAERHRHALVTGASAGLGRAFAEMLLSEGVRVWGTARDPARLAPLAAAHPGQFFPVALDLADPAGALGAYAAAAAAAGGAFDLVVQNAGYGVFGEFAAVPEAIWRAQVGGMLGTVLALSHAAFRAMQERDRGCLVHVSSLAAEFPIPYMAGYNVVKAGLSALSESLMFESRGGAVRVIDFRPGDFRTDFNHAMQKEALSARSLPAWNALEKSMAGAPLPARAAADLRSALRRDRSGVVRSGSFFQATLAPALARLAPQAWLRGAMARYFA
jgi:short-subunit dehydrogenase